MKNAGLLLEDGTFFEGSIFGNPAEAYGEVVFTTSMTGYEESITDPSYRGQILVFCYPLVGNYSFASSDLQSRVPQVRGIVVSENTSVSVGAGTGFSDFLRRHGIPALEGVDTRSLVRKVRTHGTMKGIILPSSGRREAESRIGELARMKNAWDENLVGEVSTPRVRGPYGEGRTAIIIDCGMKNNLLRDISSRFRTYVVPYSASYGKIQALEPDCIVVSSGPGDPSHAAMRGTVETLRRLSEDYPVLGVCLGHQLLALSHGAKSFKLKFGHRGTNHPVRMGGRVYITSQNHGFGLEADSIADLPMRITQTSLNDGTVEGLTHENGRIITSQYHPEGGPGPSDTRFMYDLFSAIVEKEGDARR